MINKLTLSSIDDFIAKQEQVLFTSEFKEVSVKQIQDFCLSVNQLDWFHFDEQRCKESMFGAIVAPGMFTMSLIHSWYFEYVELVNLKALFLGTDRFRILKPVKAGDKLSLIFKINRVEQRESGFAVHYDFTWQVEGDDTPVTLGNFIVRYWPL